ncbi:hypothetical protein [Terricaulis sp.]|uniref:hypothetical protein n=1 Tax=Terricaulis sp. TaxID=2768686 RepID=UPI0037834C44
MSRTLQFLVELGEDPHLRRAFEADRGGAMRGRGLTEDAECALTQGDAAAIRTSAGANGAYLPPKVIWAAA